MNRLRGLLWLGWSPLLLACASTARVTGNFADYRSYRETRVSTTLEARLGASERYLGAYPDGDYRDEVRRWFSVAEPRYFKLALYNLPRLRAYLAAMPRGPHAAAVSERIAELDAQRVFAARREQRAQARAEWFEAQLSRAANERRAFLRQFVDLTERLAGVRSLGRAPDEFSAELLAPLGIPALNCVAGRCSSTLPLAFGIPERQQLAQRHFELTLEVTLERGLVKTLTVSAPELLTRVAEAVTVRPVSADRPQERAEAVGSALDVIAAALDTPLPKDRCTAEAVSPVVLRRSCAGRRFEVIAGTEVQALDRMSLTRETSRRR